MNDLYKVKSMALDKKIGLLRIKTNITTTKLKQDNGKVSKTVQLKFNNGRFRKIASEDVSENHPTKKLHSKSQMSLELVTSDLPKNGKYSQVKALI